MVKRKPILVKINDEIFETFVIDNVQRFKENKLIRHLVDTKQVSLQRLAHDCESGKFDKKEIEKFYRDLGSSICAYMDRFPYLKIENPYRR